MRVRPAGRCLRPRQVPKNFIGPLRGRAGFGYRLESKIFAWFPCENLAGRPSPRVKHFGLSEAEGRVSEMYRGRPSLALRIFVGRPSLGTFFGRARKVTGKNKTHRQFSDPHKSQKTHFFSVTVFIGGSNCRFRVDQPVRSMTLPLLPFLLPATM